MLVALLVVSATAGAFVGPAAAQSEDEPTPAFVVDLNADGSAQLTLSLVYDLSTDTERAAFRDLQNNETAQNETRIRFRNRMQAVAEDAENATGREMSVRDPAIALSERADGDFGVVNLSVTYDGLGAVDGNEITVTEPFASGFQPDRQFVVRYPSRFDPASTSPAPATTADGRVVYESGTDLSGFELVLAEPTPTPSSSPTDSPTPADGDDGTDGEDGGDGADGGDGTDDGTPGETTGGNGPGFGVVATLVALLAAALLTVRRRQ